MRSFNRKPLLIFILVCFLTTLFTVTRVSKMAAATSGDYEYTITNGNAMITTYNGSDGNVVIPSELGGKPVIGIGDGAFEETDVVSVKIPEGVISIGEYAFSGCGSLEEVQIPESVTLINEEAFSCCSELKSAKLPGRMPEICGNTFANCDKLTDVIIPDSVTKIGLSAFLNCTGIKKINIPANVIKIEYDAFSGCRDITEFTVDDSNKSYTSADGILFNKDKTDLIQYPLGDLRKSYDIPSSVLDIGDKEFVLAHHLNTLNISESVSNITENAFDGCHILKEINVNSHNASYSSLSGVLFNKDKTELICYPSGNLAKSYTIPNGVVKLNAFSFNSFLLYSITIPKSVNSINDLAFQMYFNLNNISVSKENKKYASVDGVLFSKDLKSLILYPCRKTQKSYIIPNGVTTISRYTLGEAFDLIKITVPSSVTKLVKWAFGMDSGRVTIYGTENSYVAKYAKKNKYKFKIILASPTGLKVSNSGATAKITWKAVKTAASYKLNVTNSGKVKTYNSKSTNYKLTGLKKGSIYYFTIATVNKNGTGYECKPVKKLFN